MLTVSAPFMPPYYSLSLGLFYRNTYCSLAWLTEIFLHDLHLGFLQIVTPELLMSA